MSHAAASPRRGVRRRWRLPGLAFATACVLFLGVTVFMLPTIVNWFSQVEQADEIAELAGGVRDLGAETLHAAVEEARDYNAALTGGAILASGERIPLSEDEGDAEQQLAYDDLLAADPSGLMARVRIPAIGVDLPVYHGTSDATLEIGVGHLEGTALPVGGDSTRSVLTAHRGLATSELFSNLDRVAVGDTFTVEVFGEVLTYRVVTTEVVRPEDSRAVLPQPGRDLVTLVTCTPLGINSHRILVTGERILPTPQDDIANAGGPPSIPGFPWWIFVEAGLVVVLTIYVVLSGRAPRRTRATAGSSDPSSDPPSVSPTGPATHPA